MKSMPRVRVGGFTLIELLLSLVIVSVIMVGLLTALRSFGITEDKLDRRLAAIEESRAVAAFLEDILGRVALRGPKPGSAQGAPAEIGFVGEPGNVEWVGVMPARHGAGGMYRFRLSIADAEGRAVLVLAYLPFHGADLKPDWSRADRRVLITGVERFDVRYRLAGAGDWLPAWRSSPEPERLARISLSITAAGGPWPLLVIPVRIPLPHGAGSAIVAGPT